MSSLVMVVTLTEVPALAEQPEDWEPPAAPAVEEVAVSAVEPPPRPELGARDAVVAGDREVAWPEPVAERVALPANSATVAGVAGPDGAPAARRPGRVRAGDSPVRVGAAPLTPMQADLQAAGVVGAVPAPPGQVSVRVVDRQAARDAGVTGLMVSVARADGVRRSQPVTVEVDYSSFRNAYGGDWASRLRVGVVGECGAHPAWGRADGCGEITPLPTSNDYRAGVLAAEVPLSSNGSYTVLAVSSEPAGDNGDYTATKLKPAATWNVSHQTGAFSWDYPLRVVPGVNGPEPNLSLAYSSQAVDGLTANTNTQGSWIGDGWEMWPGYIERSYRGCADDTDSVDGDDPNNVGNETGDQCWFSDNATMSLNGRATELVKDGANTFRPVDDDGSRIERLTDTSPGNGDNNGEYWKVTTTDGTQYFFGRDRRPGYPQDGAKTNSTWTMPIYGNHPGEPCHVAGDFAGSRCAQAWRWNLDYVVDPHGNSMTLFYSRETGAYGRESNPDKRTTYHRGGTLTRIEYGTRSGSEHEETVPARVLFDIEDRCVPGSPCDKEEPEDWPDTPWDQYCESGPCTEQLAPTFWTAKRLDRVRAQVWRGSSFSTVESWSLEHEWLDAGDSEGESIPMWLKGITRTGHVDTAGGDEVSDPQITFDPGGEPLANRVDGPADGRSALNRWRVRGIFNESGGYLGIGYSDPECTSSSPPTPHTNDMRCFPQYYAPPGTGEPTLDWFHKYVVERVDVHDLTGAGGDQQTNYDYLDDPAWHYADSELVPEDRRTWSQWRGYSKVRVRQGFEQGTQSAVEYLYMRGMDGDKAAPSGGTKDVDVTDSQGVSITDHAAHNGFLREQTVLDGPGGDWVSGTINTPWRHGPTATSGPLKAYLTGTGTERTRTALEGGGTRWTKTVTTFDTTYGMPIEVDDLGDNSTSDDDLCMRYEYARNTSSWIVDKVSRTETVGVSCGTTPDRPQDVVSDERTFFDDPDTHGQAPTRGLPVKEQEVGSWDGATPQWVTTKRASFDAHGREVEVYDPLDRKTETSYTPATGGPVTSTTATNPLGHTITSEMEPAWHLPTRTTDANGHVTELAYDGLGRLSEVWLPGRDQSSQSANLQFDYLVRTDAPSAVTTRELLPDGTNYITAISLLDGQLRDRQTQRDAPGGGRVIEDTVHDSRGGVAWESKGHYSSGAPSTTLVGTAGQPQIPGITEYVYDGAERVTDEIFKVNGVEEWRTSYAYGGDRTHVTPPAGDTATTTITDARDRTVALRQYHGPTPSGPYDETTYTHTPRGDLASVTDEAGNTWSFDYDQRGRQVQAVDPDKGATTSVFDAAGQETTVTDARGVTLGYTYDALGRRTSVRDGSPAGAKRAEWVYDTLPNGIGELTRSIRYDSGHQYVSEVTGYDSAGRPTGTRVVIPSDESGLDGSYTMSTTYRPDGSIATTTLPAAGGLPPERMVYSYNDVGQQTGMTSPWGLYTFDVTYNKLGELTQRVLGSYGHRTSITYLYDDATGRLLNTSATPEQQPEVMDMAYEYDDAGNLLRIADSPGSSTASDTQCYEYDYLRRLVQAWTPAGGGADNCDDAPSVAGLGGPAPYWHSYGYDTTGNRLSKTVHAAGGDATTTYTHPAAGDPQPHTVTQAATSGPGGSALNTYGYDDAGNMTERTLVGETQTLDYDSEGNLASVTDDAGESTEFVYDADGNRLIRRDADGKTLYLPGGQEVRYEAATGTVTCTRYYTHIDTLIAVRTPGELTWMATDHHNTAEVAIRDSDLSATHRRSTAFGERRGSEPASWAGDKGFVGGTEDPTGLVHIGARMYDQSLGRFISVDPIIDYRDPQQMHGYAYGNNAPPVMFDPDGMWGFNPLEKAKSAVNSVKKTAERATDAVASGVKKAASATADFAKGVVNDIKEDPWKFATEVAVGAAVVVGAAALCGATAGVGCVVIAGAVAGAAAAGAGYGVDVAQGDKEFSVAELGTEMAVGGAVGGLTAGIGPLGRKVGGKIVDKFRRSCNSFAPGTAVAMSDGTHKPIEDIQLGDQVIATDPETGHTNPEQVVATITGNGPKHLVDITVSDDEQDAGAQAGTITATDEHPIWVANRGPNGKWIDAADLKPGDLLLTPDGATVRVLAIAAYGAIATVHNLTVTNHHTYYAAAGDAEVLTHNTNGASCPYNHGPDGFLDDHTPCPECHPWGPATRRDTTNNNVIDLGNNVQKAWDDLTPESQVASSTYTHPVASALPTNAAFEPFTLLAIGAVMVDTLIVKPVKRMVGRFRNVAV